MERDDLSELTAFRAGCSGRTLAFISGSFNVLHPGHVRLLKFARSLADVLVVGVFSDNVPSAHVPVELRLPSLESLEMVDKTVVLDADLEACVTALQPDIVVKGAEHEAGMNPEEGWLESWGGRLVFCTNDPRFSLDDTLRDMLKRSTGDDVIRLVVREYLGRHGITAESLESLFERMRGKRVCVLGDLIIDEYVVCNPLGMSREDPTLVVSPLRETRFVGGAGIVAGHASKIASEVALVTVAGKDEAAEFASAWFAENGIDATVLADGDRPTTVKRRYRALDKTLLRVNRLSQQQIDHKRQNEVFNLLSARVTETDALVFSDFSYGVLPRPLVERVTELCLREKVPIFADSQTSSQIGDLGKFKHATLVTPTEVEVRHAMGDFTLGLTALSYRLMDELSARNCITTLGGDGCLISGLPSEHSVFTDNLPALNANPVDVAGAGDSFLTIAALAMASGGDIWHAALLGSVSASLQVGRIGNTPLTKDEIRDALFRLVH